MNATMRTNKLFIILCFISVVISCDNITNQGKNSNIEKAKIAFLNDVNSISIPCNTNATKVLDPTNTFSIDWDHAREEMSKNDEIVIEVPILLKERIVADIVDSYESKHNHRCAFYKPYLIITEHENNYSYQVVAVIKDAFSSSTYLKEDHSYTDFIIVSDLDGNPINSLIRLNGKVFSFTEKHYNLSDTPHTSRMIGYKLGSHFATKAGGQDGVEDTWYIGRICNHCNHYYNATIWESTCPYCGYDEYIGGDVCIWCCHPIDECVCKDKICPGCGRHLQLCSCGGADREPICPKCGHLLGVCGGNCE